MRCLLYEDGWDGVGTPQERLRIVLQRWQETRDANRKAEQQIEALKREREELRAELTDEREQALLNGREGLITELNNLKTDRAAVIGRAKSAERSLAEAKESRLALARKTKDFLEWFFAFVGDLPLTEESRQMIERHRAALSEIRGEEGK
jgi:chromosome segregation ATPase